MKKPLVAPLQKEAEKGLADLVEFYEETLGFCPNSVKTMYRRPAIAEAFIALNKAVMENHGNVSSSLKRLIGFVVSHLAGCSYCQAHTIRAAERYGASEEKLNYIWEFETHPGFNAAERAALRFAIAASAQPSNVNDAISNELRQFWNDGEIVEILGVVALFGFLNRWNDGMATEIENLALQSGEKYLQPKGWSPDRHTYE